MSLGMSLNTFHTSQYVPLMFIQNIKKTIFFFSKFELTFFTQMKVGTYFILVSFMAHPMSFSAPFLDALDLHLDTCITHYVVPNFHFHPLSNCSKEKKRSFGVCCWCPSWCPFYPSSHLSSSFISPLSSRIIGPSLVCSLFTLPFFVVGFIYQLVFFLFVVSTPTSTTSQSLVCL